MRHDRASNYVTTNKKSKKSLFIL